MTTDGTREIVYAVLKHDGDLYLRSDSVIDYVTGKLAAYPSAQQEAELELRRVFDKVKAKNRA